MKNLYAPALLALACSATVPATANDQLEEIVVTSSRVEMPLRQLGTSVSVVSAGDIMARGFNNLADVLRYEPAVSVSNTGGAGKATSLRIRGENGFRTKVLIDGIDITNTSSPQAGPHFEQLSSAATERVEILRGPQGLMYGADAGGVLAITSRRGEAGFGGGVSGEFGRYGTGQAAGHLGGANDVLDLSMSGSQYETDGFNSRTSDTLLRDDDGYENTTFHGRAGWKINRNLRAELVGHRVEGKNEYDDCYTVDSFAPTDDCSDDFDQDAWRATLLYQGSAFRNQLSYSENAIDREFFSQGRSSFAADSTLEKTEYIGSWSPSDVLRLVYGLERLNESMDDGSFDTDRDQDGYYLEYQGGFADTLFLTAGVRHDDNDDFGSAGTYRFSGAYLLPMARGELKFKATWGTGFRAPSLYEISYNGGPFAYAPASGTALDAEESDGYDLGIAWYDNAGWFAEAIWFDQRVDNEIYFDLVSFSGYLQGDGESRSRGLELIGEIPLGDTLALTGNYTYNDTEDADGQQRLRVPQHLGYIGLSFRPWDGRLALNAHLRMARDAAAEFSGPIDDYEVLDLNASFRLLDNLEVYGRVENITDEDYVEVPTYNSRGAAAYAGLRYSF